jgi:4'-phosphopantetheinyl transferase
MTFSTVFQAAMPAPGWGIRARDSVLVALFMVDDWRPWLSETRGMLDIVERARVDRQRQPAQRELLAFAYTCHRLLLSAVLDRPAADVPLMRDAKGCPRLRDDSAHTSLSHSDGLVALAVSMSGPVGVDIEPLRRAATMPEIAGRICHPQELADLSTLSAGMGRNLALLALWVRKESLLKAAGIGLEREMDSFLAPADVPLALHPGRTESVVIRMLDGGTGAIAAVAGPKDIPVSAAWLRPNP